MSKKYLIILGIVIAAAAGMFIYQNQKTKDDLRSHHHRQYKRIIEAARQSSLAGLVHMASALNKYKEKNGAYPTQLSALHPDFIPEKAFINDLQWDYKPSGDSFHLSKTIRSKKNQLVTASIGPSLRPQQESKTMVASATASKRAASGVATKPAKKSPKPGVSRNSPPQSKPKAKTLTPDIPAAGLKKFGGKLSASTKRTALKEKPLPNIPKVKTIKLTEKEQFIHGINRKFLVWKNADGSLGFSNIQYPSTKELAVYDNGEWVQIPDKNWYAKTPKDVPQHNN
jgi:type II secretory pathway pseudopilin PulG